MGFWGKVVGGVGGFLVGGPLGALVGAAAGHAVDTEGGVSAALDKVRAQARGMVGAAEGMVAGGRDGHARQQAFAVAVIALGAKMAKADGRVTRDEVAAFKRVFHIPDDEIAAVGAVFDRAKQSAQGYEIYALQIAAVFRGHPEVLEELLGALYQIALADGALHPKEVTFLREVARLFQLPPHVVDRLRARFEGAGGAGGAGAGAGPGGVDDGPDPYAVLGVSPDASDAEVRAAWTRLARKHHPDTLLAAGLPEAFIEQATRTMASINHAYDRIRERRGLR
ncbi:TerB family tellurite resistance protein [Roseospira visakhapatnamensis]|uniref:DnaJ like chaperone protein n=1 Tax=Roseospira visakhapatnamensis TaxID=390880 RepID=A0A7W6RA30_9PROT|nr:TerB family tellurite resistance protein [Roseospira visakhapatnamensis]MBB4264667.1 DnaJ like chaperone protein [Roseospira visakhapatnamensis]